jgi:serine/threonine protein kinase
MILFPCWCWSVSADTSQCRRCYQTKTSESPSIHELLVGSLTVDVDRDQIYGLYRELAYLSIAHRDIRYYNILYAPPSPSSPSLPVPFRHKKSPFTIRTYKYRLVDFDRSRRINLTFKEQAINDLDWIEKIIDGVENGRILDPTTSQLASMSWSMD